MSAVDSVPRWRRRLAAAVPITVVAATLSIPMTASAASTVPTGGYTGTSDAYNGATVDFQIDEDGRMAGFSSESYLFCGMFPTPIQWAEQPPLQVTAGVPFTQEWTFSDVEYELSGVISAAGVASGTGVAKMPSLGCTGFDFEWSATADEPVVVDPEVSVSPGEVEVSDLADPGVTVSGSGFVADASVSLTVGGVDGGSSTANADGDVTFTFATTELAPGTYPVVASSADGDAETTLTVIADPVVVDPEVSVSPGEVEVSALADPGVTVSGSGFVADATVALTVGGIDGGSDTANADGDVTFTFATTDLAPGTYPVIASSADGDAETTLTVVADPVVVDPEVSVSPGEVEVSDLADPGVTVSGSGFVADATVALTVGGVDGGSATANADGDVTFTFTTTELAPGTYPVVASSADGDAETTLTVIADPVVVDPEVSVSPGEVEVSDLADPGVTVSGSGFVADATVALTVGGIDGGSATANADGDVSFTFTTTDLAPGAYPVVASSADGDAETTLTVVADPVPGLPGQIPEETPDADTLNDDNRGDVTVPDTADEGSDITVRIGDAEPGDVIGVWVFSTPQYLGTFRVSEDLDVVVSLPEGVTGDHRIAVYAADESLVGWDGITISAVDDGEPAPGDGNDSVPGDGQGEDQLPATGGDSRWALAVAALLALGGGLLLAIRRLRATTGE